MTSADEPRRLLDDAGDGTGELRSGLERMSRDLPDAEQLARMAARLGISPPPVAEPTPPSSSVRSLAAKVAGGAVIAGGIAFAVYYALRSNGVESGAQSSAPIAVHGASDVASSVPGVAPRPSAQVGPVPRGDSAQSAPITSGATTQPPPTEALPPTPALRDAERPGSGTSGDTEALKATSPSSRAPSASERSNPSSTSQTASPPPRPRTADVPAETDLLRDARLVLDRNPAQALALSEQHRQKYPNGAFSQEREVIAITALARLGRSAEASARAERFRTLYPSSPYTARIDGVVPP